MKISIRFFDDQEVRAIWDEENAKWVFSVLDIVGVLNEENDYAKTRNYWVDWSKIGKTDYMNGMIKSASNSTEIKTLLKNALTNEINSREMFMKGIDYSYYYEENE